MKSLLSKSSILFILFLTVNTAVAQWNTVGNGLSSDYCHELTKLNGIVTTNVSYDDGNAIIKYDQSKTDTTEIKHAINSTGYTVTDIKEN